MPAVAIVSEYNPFHNGHLYQIQKIKELFPGAAVISVMSGSLVQRGELALFSKYERAKTAVKCGVDAVFELPSVYSCAPANIFAYSALYILHNLSGVGYVCFGSECGDLELLGFAAEKISRPEFGQKLRETVKTHKNESYPKNVYNLFCGLYGEKKASVLNGSNNILAIEYLKALKKLNSGMIPVTVKREGADFKSAGCIRGFIKDKMTDKIKNSMPDPAYGDVIELVNKGKYSDISSISPAVIFRLCGLDAGEIAEFAGVSDTGAAKRIKSALDGCFDYSLLEKKLAAKHSSPSSVKRMILSVFFGITKEMQHIPPAFTTLLAANETGRAFMGKIRKNTKIKIITKPADICGDKVFEKNLFIDNAHTLSLYDKTGEINMLKQKPFI